MPNFTRMLFLCKNFKIWNILIQGLFKDFQGPTLFSRTFEGLEFFPKIQGLLKDPMNPGNTSQSSSICEQLQLHNTTQHLISHYWVRCLQDKWQVQNYIVGKVQLRQRHVKAWIKYQPSLFTASRSQSCPNAMPS